MRRGRLATAGMCMKQQSGARGAWVPAAGKQAEHKEGGWAGSKPDALYHESM